MIAASIAMMAVLNLTQRQPAPQQRMAIVFACGLLHGLGFASSMAEMGLDGMHRIISLLGFNLGIELGQALFLAALLLLHHVVKLLAHPLGLDRIKTRFSLAQAASVVALLTAGYWFVERLAH